MEPLKRCNLCEQELPATAQYFQPGKGFRDGLNPRCRKCCSRRQMELRKTFTERQAHDEAMRLAGQRRCRVCLEYKPASLEYFCERACNSSGLNSMCKACQAISNLAQYKSRRNDPAKAAKDAANSAERTKRWTRKNPDKVSMIQRNYRQANADVFRIHARRREALKLSLPSDYTPADWQFALDYFGGCCAACGRPLIGIFHQPAMDHWIPLSSPDCPGTVPANIVPLCHGAGGCNGSKSARPAEQWLVDKFGKKQARAILAKVQEYFSQVRQV